MIYMYAMYGCMDAGMHAYLRVVYVDGQRGQSRIAGLGSYSTIIQSYREDRGKIAYEYRVGFHDDGDGDDDGDDDDVDDDDDDEITLCILLYVPMRHDHLIIWSHTADDVISSDAGIN
jgi:hypothetical protein